MEGRSGNAAAFSHELFSGRGSWFRYASERSFGTIKRMTAGGRFLTRGLKKVGGDAALSVLAYNIIRAINLIGAATLRAEARLSRAKTAPEHRSLRLFTRPA
jgi:hypothetical protein